MATPLTDLDVREIEGLAGKAADVALARLGIHLDPRRSADLHEYLVDLGLRMSTTYDPEVGQAFSTYFYRRARMRVIDWLRATHGDKRYGNQLKKLAVTYGALSLDHVSEEDGQSLDEWRLGVEDPEPDSLADAIVELGRDLSPDARWALVNVAGRVAEGFSEGQAIAAAAGANNGEPRREALRRFEMLREELAAGAFTRMTV